MTAPLSLSDALDVLAQETTASIAGGQVPGYDDAVAALALVPALRETVALSEGLERLAEARRSVSLDRYTNDPWLLCAYDVDADDEVVGGGATPLAAISAALAALKEPTDG